MDNKTDKPKRRKITEKQRSARRQNIVSFNQSRAGRPALKHGIRAVMTTGEIPPGVRGGSEVTGRVDEIIRAMVVDMGYESQEDLPAQRRALLASQRLALLVLGLASEFLTREGLFDAKGRPHPLLSVVGLYVNSVRLNAVALGLERKPRKVGPVTLEEYLDAKGGGTDSASEPPKAVEAVKS